MKCFLKNITLRPSCYSCPTRDGRSNSDIIIGDFWGIDKLYPEFDDNKGCSALIVYSEKGARLINEMALNIHAVNYSDILNENPVLRQSVAIPATRVSFWSDFNSTRSIKKRYQIMCVYGLGYKETVWRKCKFKYLDFKERVFAKLMQLFNEL